MVLRHRIVLALWKNPIDHLIEAVAAEIQTNALKIVCRAIADVVIKAEVFLVVPKVKELTAHIAYFNWIIN